MNNFFRTIIAGYGAKKLGGGCLSTIVIFILIYVALGQCNRETVPGTKINSESPAFVINKKTGEQKAALPSTRAKKISYSDALAR